MPTPQADLAAILPASDRGLAIVARGGGAHAGDASSGWLVVDKPAGLLTVPGRRWPRGSGIDDCVIARVRAMFAGATGSIGVHRLDMDTSGLVLCALDPRTHAALGGQFERREVDKVYTALVDALVEIESGTIDLPVRPEPTRTPYQVVDRSHRRPARTSWRVIASEGDATRLELRPLTGRTHQLRVHCAYPGPGGLRGPKGSAGGRVRGHPILGDVLYGPPVIDPRASPRLMLHASTLTFTDPATGERVTARSETPF